MAQKYGSKECSVPGCIRTDGYKINGVRYCDKHGQRLRKYGSVELPPRVAHNKGVPLSEETKKKLSAALKGRKVHNKIQFTDEQLKLILDTSRPSRAAAKELGIGKTTVLRLRNKHLN